MADIQVDTDANSALNLKMQPRSLVWTSPSVGYCFFVDGTGTDLYYIKTINSGATWGSKTAINTNLVQKVAVWYDRWTEGDTGTLIHIAYIVTGADDIIYNSLDTSDDSLGGEVVAYNGSTATGSPNWANACISIVKSRGGNIFVGGWIDADAENGFAKGNADPPTSFTSKTSMADGVAADKMMFLAGNEADADDIWCVYYDLSANEITLKVYDDSANTWSESAAIDTATGHTSYFNFDVMDRHSDNKAFLVLWNEHNSATADLAAWEIADSSTFNSKTDVVSNSTTYSICSLMINQQNDDLYVAYSDDKTLGNIVYKKSTDGGANWGSETAMSADTADDHRNIFSGTSVGDDGGRWMPVWVNDDLLDLMCNSDNSVNIAAVSAGTNIKINIGDTWKSVDGLQINIGDAWKTVAGVQINIGDTWKAVF